MSVKFSAVGDFDSYIPSVPGAKFVCVACCEHVRLVPTIAADGKAAIEAYCAAQRHPSMLLRDGKVIGTSA